MLDRKELETAYWRAGRSFNGQLRQNFVVLNEYDQETFASVDPGRAGTSRPGAAPRFPRRRGGGGGTYGGESGRSKGTKRSGDSLVNENSKK
jgi:hypothetical protein